MRRNRVICSVVVLLLSMVVLVGQASAFTETGTVGVSYSSYVDGINGNYKVALAVPPGLSFRRAGSRLYLEGTPTKAGSYHFELQYPNPKKTTRYEEIRVDNFYITIKAKESKPAANNGEFLDNTMTLKRYENRNEGKVGQVYRETIRVNVKDPNLGYSPFSARLIKGSLPPGVKLSADSSGYWAYLEGTAKQAGTYSFTVRVLNKRKGYQDMSFTIKITK